MKRIKTLLHIISALAIASCTKSSLDLSYSQQAEKIDSYVTSQLEAHPDYRAEYTDGIVRLVIAEGEGDFLKKDGHVAFRYEGYDFSNSSISTSTLFATNKIDVARQAGWDTADSTRFEIFETDLKDSGLIEGLRKGLQGVRAGEDCYIIFSGKFGFGNKHIGTIPANSPLSYRIQVTSIDNK